MREAPARHTDGAISEDLLRQLVYNQKMAELGMISAGVVHELNAPLSVITSASQMILREEGVPEFVREMVARINTEAQRLSQLTRGLLSFSSHDSLATEADVNLTMEFVLNFLSFEAASRGVTLIKTPGHHLPVVKADGNVLKQILLNIIMNALQAMEENGGSLMVESSTPNDKEVCIVISDTGPGIPPETLAQIFEPYFTTKKPGEGTGLGLFVTRTLVEKLGGNITASSTLGEGTTFSVTMPAGE
jgi:signal transduction histidine kinase